MFYSTNPGEASSPFAVAAQLGSISTLWTIEGNNLVWKNGNFSDGEAIICMSGSVILVYFTEAPPSDCTPIVLSLLPGML